MAFGISPKYKEEYQLDGLSRENFMVLAIEAVKLLGWEASHVSEAELVAYTPFSWRSYSEEFKLVILDGHAVLKSECTGSQLADWGKNKKNVAEFVRAFEEVKQTFTAEQLEEKAAVLRTALESKGDEDIIHKGPLTTKEKVRDVFSIFRPVEGYYITPIIIILNIIVFIVMIANGVGVFLPETADLIKWGANFKPMTLNGEWWRIITSCFLHIGLLHLLLNMYALLYIGSLLEPYLGRTRFLSAYLLTGIFSSVASLWWHDLTVSAGASGAIFGMYGVFLAMLTTNLIEKSARKALLTSIGVFVAYNLVNGMKAGIDNAAHTGGLLSGIVIGYALVPGLKKPGSAGLKYGVTVLMAVLFIGLSFVVVRTMPNYVQQYDAAIAEFSENERLALQIYELPSGTSNEETLSKIKDMGIYYWNKNIVLVKGLEKLDMPDVLKRRNSLLLEYCDARVRSYELIYRSIEENSDRFADSIKYYDQQVTDILAKIEAE
jgi:rhomboid protease GluP